MELQETSTQPAASSFTSLSPPPDRPAVASTTTTTSFYAPGPASSSLPPSPSTSTTTTTTATKKDAFVRLSPNQAHDTVIIKDEDDTENSFVMNQLAPLPTTSSTLTSPTPPRLPSFHFPPLASTAAPGPAAPPPLPLTALAPSLFTSTSSSSSSSSSSSTSSSPSSSPMLSPFLTPTTTSPSPPHMAAGSASSSTPVAAPLSQQQQQQAMLTAAQQIARLNSLTQMTSQIAAIALDAEAAKAAWVADMSRSLQTELQSVYLHLHSGGAETAVPPPQSSFSSSSTSPPPSLSFTPGTSPSAPPLLPTPQKLQLSSSPTHSPLQAAAAATLPPPPPGFPGHGHGRHLPVQPAAAIMPVLAPTTPSTPASDVAEDKKTGGRRRRKPKTKDSFNHMQRKCASCQRTETTKWRHGPLGSNTLCNTCGLAYSRKKKREAEQAKQLQQGGNPQAVMPPTPATSASPPTP